MAAIDPSRTIEGDVALGWRAHRRLLADLDELVERDELDVAARSRLPDWTIGHVITHVTNSGDGHARVLRCAANGVVGMQYPDGIEGRAADIEAGASRPADEQVAALRRSISALESLWASSSWIGSGTMSGGRSVPISDLPFLRVREVAIHHIDLGLTEFEDLPIDYVRRELLRLEMLWCSRRPMGMAALPDAALALTPTDRLAWLTGRLDVAGLSAAGVF